MPATPFDQLDSGPPPVTDFTSTVIQANAITNTGEAGINIGCPNFTTSGATPMTGGLIIQNWVTARATPSSPGHPSNGGNIGILVGNTVTSGAGVPTFGGNRIAVPLPNHAEVFNSGESSVEGTDTFSVPASPIHHCWIVGG